MSSDTVTIHIDMNNFYVGCHLLFHPALQDRPVVILSANDGNVIAASAKAKLLGIKRGTPLFDLQPWIEPFGIVVFSAAFPLYADMSRRVLETVSCFSPEIEYYSVDEVFVRAPLANTEALWRLAQSLRQTLLTWVGLASSIGLGPTKVLAKLATRQAKQRPEGICDLISDPFARNRLLQQIPLQDIWGLGARSVQKLHEIGVFSAAQFIRLPDWRIRSLLHVRGTRLAWELRGYSVLPLEELPPSPRSISRMRSFGEAITDQATLEEALCTFVTRAAEKLRRHALAASSLAVLLGTGNFHQRDAHSERTRVVVLPTPTNSTRLFQQAIHEIVPTLFVAGQAYRRAGVHLLGLVPATPQQQSLFVSPEQVALEQRLTQLVDAINRRYGRDTLYFGSHDPQRRWQKQQYPSRAYTSRWEDIPVVRA